MEILLNATEIQDAVTLGARTLSRFQGVWGRYNNRFNSHVKGKLGEIAVEQLLQEAGYDLVPHFRNEREERLCDIEILQKLPITRFEIKTWSIEHWETLGRCIQVEQLPAIEKKADVIVWCTIDLPRLQSASDLQGMDELVVNVVGYSLLSDVRNAPIGPTGPKGGRQVVNYQLAQSAVRSIEELLSKLAKARE